MNKFYKISLLHNTLIAAVLLVLFVPQFAHAQSFVHDILWRLVNAVFGYAAAIGGMTLDYAVAEYVVGFGENFRDSGTGNSVDALWTIVRDVFNLTFIFGLVYIGLKMILRSGDSQARSTLVSLILAALLVNFSLFITKFVVDFSNIAAAQIAGAFMREGSYQISASFMNIMGHSALFNARGSLENIAGTSAGFTFIFGTMFLYIVLAFVFLAGGIMLIIRYVVLIIYMILSPVMFLGWVFPGFAGASKDFWSKFLSRAFFAPAYLLMLYFSNQVLVNMQGAGGVTVGNLQGGFVSSGGPTAGSFAAVFPFFFMAAGFLIASLVVAQKMGTVGASTAISAGQRLRGYTQKAVGASTFGAAGAVGRNTVGRGANAAANSAAFNRLAAKSSFAAGALKATKGVADSSFDARRVGGLGKAAGIGEGAKGGYSSKIKAKQKADVEFAKSLSEGDVSRGVDGKLKKDPGGKLQAQIDADIEKQKNDVTTEYGYAVKKLSEARQQQATLKENAELSSKKKDGTRNEISKLEKQLQDAEINQDLALAEETKEKIKVEKANLDLLEKETAAAEANLVEAEKTSKKAVEAQKKAATAAKDSAESKIVYANQLEFTARREKEANRWRSKMAAAGGLVAGAGTGALVGSAFGPVGTAVGAVAGAFAGPITTTGIGARAREGASELRKQYGTDGTVKKKASQKEKELKILTEQIKESGLDTKSEPADE